jgi:hypothetical protein
MSLPDWNVAIAAQAIFLQQNLQSNSQQRLCSNHAQGLWEAAQEKLGSTMHSASQAACDAANSAADTAAGVQDSAADAARTATQKTKESGAAVSKKVHIYVLITLCALHSALARSG